MSSHQHDQTLSRDLFSDKDFCAIRLLNTLSNKVLYRYLPNTGLKKPTAGGGGGDVISCCGDGNYLAIASDLTTVHETIKGDIEAFLQNERVCCADHESNTRASAIEEKTLLSGVRVGLEGTSRRLCEMEDRLANAAATTIGIEQYLAQASARVTRGRATCNLHRRFVNMSAVDSSELDAIMKNLSNTRREQRQQKTDEWRHAGISKANHNYFSNGVSSTGEVAHDGSSDNDELSEFSTDISDESDDDERQRRKSLGTSSPTYRAEIVAVAAGLEKVFVCRNRTEAAVAWIGRLVPLASKLSDLFPKAAENIASFSSWLQQELISDFFHLTKVFYGLYDKDEANSVSCPLGKVILRSISIVVELHSTLSGSSDVMLGLFLKDTQNVIQDAIDDELKLTPLPPLVPLSDPCDLVVCDVFATHTVHEIVNISEYLLVAAQRALIIVGAISEANVTSGKQQVITAVVDLGLIPFVSKTLDTAFERADEVLRQEGKLSPRSRRQTAYRVADTVSYSLTMLSHLFVTSIEHARRIFNFIDASASGALISPIEECFEQRRRVYATERSEVSLINRYMSQIVSEYDNDLEDSNPYDYGPAHTQKMKEIVTHTEECLERCVSLAISSDMEGLLRDIAMHAFTGMGNFLSVEIKKAYESCKNDVGNWRRYRKTPDEYLENAKQESHVCAMRVLLWAQTSILSVSECIIRKCSTVIPQNPRLISIFEDCKIKAIKECDKRSEELINIVLHAIVVRSLNLLVHLQEKYDYRPKGDVIKKGQGWNISDGNSVACITFCKYLAIQLNEAKTFIHLSSQPLPTVDAVQEGTLPGDGGLSSGMYLPSNSDQTTKSSSFSANANAEEIVASLSLHQMMFPNVPTFARVLGVSLYKGLSAHLKGFFVNDVGSLIFKKDTALYRSTMQLLVEVSGLDGVVVGALFDILKECSNLLIIPFDNISTVKQSGRLALLSDAEKVCYLKMRLDLKEAFRRADD